jgi:hypothetical protein
MKMKFYPPFNRGRLLGGEARLICYLDGKWELRGDSEEDRVLEPHDLADLIEQLEFGIGDEPLQGF